MKIIKVMFRVSDDIDTGMFVEWLKTECGIGSEVGFDTADPSASRAEVVHHDEQIFYDWEKGVGKKPDCRTGGGIDAK